MKALLLAAGLGTRLRPVTDVVPKCLVPVAGKPLLQYWFENLSDAGVEGFVVNTHYKAEQVEAFIASTPYVTKTVTAYEPNLLLTAGTLLHNRAHYGDEAVMLVHADNLSFCDFSAFMQAHRDRPAGCEITMMTFTTPTPQSCGIVERDDEGIVQAFHEKVPNPPGNLANGAVYIVEPSVVGFLAGMDKAVIDFSTEVLPAYLGRIYTFHNACYHRDIGTLESYGMAQVEMMAMPC